MPAINECMSLLQEVQEFLASANLSFQGMAMRGGTTAKTAINGKVVAPVVDGSTFTSDLEHYCTELDSALASLQLCLQIQQDCNQ